MVHNVSNKRLTDYFFVVLVYRTVNDLSCEEFHEDVRFKWGNRPFWYGEDQASPDSPMTTGYWGIWNDWAEPKIEQKCFLGR